MKALLSASHEILVALNTAHSGLPLTEVKQMLNVGLSESKVFTSNNAFYNSVKRMRESGLVKDVRVDTGLGFTIKGIQLTDEGSKKLSELNCQLEIAKERIQFIEGLQQGASA